MEFPGPAGSSDRGRVLGVVTRRRTKLWWCLAVEPRRTLYDGAPKGYAGIGVSPVHPSVNELFHLLLREVPQHQPKTFHEVLPYLPSVDEDEEAVETSVTPNSCSRGFPGVPRTTGVVVLDSTCPR